MGTWDRIYKEQGEVQSEILPTVKVEKDILRDLDAKK